MRNKFVSVFLAFLMIIGSIYAVPTAHALSTTNTDGVTLRKTASLQLDQLNRWTIDLELEFKPIVKSQDIVIVFDKSGSMDSNSRLENAKTAAKDFTDILLNTADGPHNNKIALVTFSGGYWEAASFTSNATSLKNKIEDIDANGGTFTQGGLKKARDMLASSNADNKIIVLLTDGLPTYGFGLSAAGKTKYDAQTPTTADTQNSYRETITITFTVRVKDSLDTDAVKKLHNLATIGTETPDVDIPTGK
ncbi:MAG: VWA domain-containing protein, partial [Erysipelothrix sp.]|nr:VWA domain-containing protein [Erysipelothrix sp.]